MPPRVFAVVLVAAALNASWNALLKLGSDKRTTAFLVAVAAGILAAVILPFLSSPAPASYPFIVASAAIQVGYFLLLANAYQYGDLGQIYPLMRGIAPLIVTVLGVGFLGETLSPMASTGILLICAGTFGMAFGAGRDQARGAAYAVANAVLIAGYTLNDGVGARVSGSPVAYTLWCSLLCGMLIAVWLVLWRRKTLVGSLRIAGLWRAFLCGAATLIAYSLVLWAMTVASIPEVASLRETSIVFSIAISVLVLKERVQALRVASACVIAAGAAAIRIR